MSDRTLVLLSRSIFTGLSDDPFDGYIAIRGNRIESVGPAGQAEACLHGADEVRDLGSKTVMAGLVDVHTFFTGWVLRRIGADLSDTASVEDVIEALAQWKGIRQQAPMALGMNLPEALLGEELVTALDERYSSTPVVAFTNGAETCALNAAASSRYGFTPDACYAEKIWRLMRDYLPLQEVRDAYDDYMVMLNSRGVTAIKEMCFDDYYGFADEMAHREQEGELTVRIDMMSQPVGYGADLDYACSARDRFQGDFVRFSGFNRMTDRGVWCGLAEMIEPYEDGADAGAGGKTVVEEPEWDLIARELTAIDKAGFRYSLHCQGDGAVRKTVDMCEGLAHDESGKLVNRHSITDLENSDPADLARFGAMGGICEVYPQILTLDAREDCLAMMRRQIGEARLSRSWNRRAMVDGGCTLCCGTDLPLLIPHLGDSIYSACGGYFADGLEVNPQNAVSIAELLRAWTAGGAYDLQREDDIGTIEAGKLADICVLDRDVFAVDPKEARDIKVELTVVDGRIVYES